MDYEDIKLLPVESSSIKAAGYDPDTRVMVVEFTTGAKYAYFSVLAEEYGGFLAAKSQGVYLAAHIKRSHDCSGL